MDKNDIEAYLVQVIRQCRAVQIPISNRIDPKIIINSRAKSRFAACRKIKQPAGTIYRIEVGSALMETDAFIVKNILVHELLHTCHGCYNHGSRWKRYAEKMNQLYGYHITTTATYKQLGLPEPEKKKTLRYRIACQNCGTVFYRQKKSRLVTNTGEYRCRCGGKLICTKIQEQDKE